MDPELKRAIIDDLDRFVRKEEFYKKVGKAWKRGYLLYGPPGKGKSSLIAAMANYLKFDIYDLELSGLYDDSDLKRNLLATSNRSKLVIEDIARLHHAGAGCRELQVYAQRSIELHGRFVVMLGGQENRCVHHQPQGSARPCLVASGRMDVHINMSYCASHGFKLLASNYHGITNRQSQHLYGEIEALIDSTEVTPAEVAEELTKSDDANVAFEALFNFLQRKKAPSFEIKDEGTNIK